MPSFLDKAGGFLTCCIQLDLGLVLDGFWFNWILVWFRCLWFIWVLDWFDFGLVGFWFGWGFGSVLLWFSLVRLGWVMVGFGFGLVWF